MHKFEHTFEMLLFKSRWLLAPFYVGLVFAIVFLLIKFIEEFFHILMHITTISGDTLTIEVLHLIDLSLMASLLIIIILSGYESFVSKIEVGAHEDKPSWMGKLGFTELKIKLIASIVAISAIDLLAVFLNMKEYSDNELFWKVLIHFVFVVSGVLFALMDRLSPYNSDNNAKKSED